MMRFNRCLVALAAAAASIVAAQPADAALVAYYNYDNGGNLGLDSSGTGNNLINSGSPTAGAGRFGGGLELDGVNSMLIPAGPFPTGVPTGNSAYTTASWINPDTGGNRGIVGWGNYGTGNQVNAFRMNGNNQLINYWWGNDMVVTAPADLTIGASPAGWQHVTATYNPVTREQRIYLNGAQIGARVATGLNAQASNFAVGRTCCAEFFDGQLDDTAIYNHALAPNQIVALGTGAAQPNSLPAASPLVGLYRFESSNVGLDSSGVMNNLLAQGNAAQTGAGKFGSGLQLDGNGDFLSQGSAFPSGVPFGDSGYAISAWVKPAAATNAIGQQNGIVGWGNYGAGNEVTAIRIADDAFPGANGFRHYWWGADQDLADGGVNLLDGQYHHVVAQYDNITGARSVYLNGLLLGTDFPADHNAAPLNFTIGRTASGVFGLNEWFNGMMDDVAIFNRSLSLGEIQAIGRGDFSAFLPAATGAVPEPATAMLGILGAGLLGLRRRRAA